MRRDDCVDALFRCSVDPTENEARLERPSCERAGIQMGVRPAPPRIGLAVLFVIVAVNGEEAAARCAGTELVQECNREKHPSIVRPAVRAEERLPIAAGVAGATAADVAVGDAVDVIAVAVAGVHRAVWLVIVEVEIARGNDAAEVAIDQRIGIVPLEAVGMAGRRLVMTEVRHRIAQLERALVRAVRTAIVRIGRDRTVGGVCADVLEDPVPRVGRMRASGRRPDCE